MDDRGAVLLDQYSPESISNAVMINEAGVPDDQVWSAMSERPEPLLAALGRWARDTRRGGGLFERDRYVTPKSIYDQMLMAQDAAENDNIVSGVLESTEALAFSRMSIESFDEDEDDVWEQILIDLDLDARFREMWRELFTVSQFYAVTWWGKKTYKVRGRDMKTGNKRKKVFANLNVPVAITLLDPMKVIPVGDMMFNQEKLCYIATRSEGEMITQFLDENRSDDQVIANLMVKRYEPSSQNERKLLGELGVAVDLLFELNPQFVWRHTATRPQYQRFADVRLRSVFELLDLKHQLREMDRAHLVGGTNFIILVKKGSDAQPAHPSEIQNLQAQVRTLARVPVIVGDHRLTIEIVTPKLDNVLKVERHDMLDEKIAARLYQTFITNSSSKKDDTLKLARVVARGLESRRYMLKQQFERRILLPTYDRNEMFQEIPKLSFHPNQIALDFDPSMAQIWLDVRDRGDISRDTMLNQLDLDQDDELRKRKREKDLGYDDVFETTVPFTGMNPNNPDNPADKPGTNVKAAGRSQGGNKSGGGRAPGTGQGVSKDQK